MGKANAKSDSKKIIIDQPQGLVFSSEDKLYEHFSKDISRLEAEFLKLRKSTDITEDDFIKYEENLKLLLEDPDEIWSSADSESEYSVFIREFDHPLGEPNAILAHIAVVYLTNSTPSFVYLHFPTTDTDLIAEYQRGAISFDRFEEDIPDGAIEGDALFEGEELAIGLYEAMLTLRSEDDIPETSFRHYGTHRERTIENPDEIWRNSDSLGNILVNFISECTDPNLKGLHYVVVTIEDTPSSSHALLFSFPTTDASLIDRYRHGENLQAEEVVQESSH